ncbi:MAG: protein kinase [Alistipes sp.]|nr:protein kinase [Alistipes sp.]
MELTSGTLLQGGRYRIIKSLGRGGFGMTYCAEQVMAKREVCIKEFFPKNYYTRGDNTSEIRLSSEGFAESMNRHKSQFIKEAQMIAGLNHPNIIHIFDVFEENNTAYYVMEYIEGDTLSDIVKRYGAMSESNAINYICQVATALNHIHQRYIMHLDIKPANIIVRKSDGCAILIDFGLSKQYHADGDETSATPIGVSVGYAPIEQSQVGGVRSFSPETDIYSLGATLYYIVTGSIPPAAAELESMELTLPARVSDSVRNTITKSMQFLRRERPHSILEFLELIGQQEAFATNESIEGVASPNISEAIEDDSEHTIFEEPEDGTLIDVAYKPNSEIAEVKQEPEQISLKINNIAKEPEPDKANSTTTSSEAKIEKKSSRATKKVTKSKSKKRSKKGWWIGMVIGFIVALIASFTLVFMMTNKDTSPTEADTTQQPTTTPSDSRIMEYTVMLGDTQAKIAKLNCMTIEELNKLNPDVSWNQIRPDDRIKILLPPNDEIWYTTTDKEVAAINMDEHAIISNKYDRKQNKGVIKFKEDISEIQQLSFYTSHDNTSNLYSIALPNSVKEIGFKAFEGCTNLKNINLPSGVETIGEEAFFGCSKLRHINTIGNKTVIGYDAFKGTNLPKEQLEKLESRYVFLTRPV